MPEKDNVLLLLFPGSHALAVTHMERMLFKFILKLNISVTNSSVCATTFGQLSPKCPHVVWRCFILCNTSSCDEGFLAAGSVAGIWCKFHSH